MNAFPHFPARLHWTAQQLADAVPLRLHELYAFEAARDGRGAANGERRRRPAANAYAAPASLPARFDIR